MKKLIIFLLSTFILSVGVSSCGGGSSGTSNPGGGGVSNQALITSFTIDGQLESTVINDNAGTITVYMPQANDLLRLSPSIEVSTGASVLPASEEEQDFSDSVDNPVEYTVTAEDGTTTKVYSVTVESRASDQALITSFTIDGQLDSTFINNDAGIIVIEMPLAIDLTSLIPSIEVSIGASVVPAGGIAQDFSDSDANPMEYTVTAEDGITTKVYSVTVESYASNQALITSFTINGQLESNIDDNIINVNMPLGTDLTSPFSPIIEVSIGATVDPASGVEQDFFGSHVFYTVTAENGGQSIYQVSVGISPLISYNPYDADRLGAGDLYKEDLLTVSNVRDGNNRYIITLGDYSREEIITVTNGSFNVQISDPNGSNYSDDELTADGTLNSDQVKAGVDGDVRLSLGIGDLLNIEYFNQTVNKEQYILKTANDVQGIQHDLDGDYTLANDIDMSSIANFRPIAYDKVPGGDHDGAKFSGTIDGSGYTINNLTIDRENEDYIALISYANNEAIIKNIGLRNITIVGNDDVGGLIGFSEGGEVVNSYVSGSVSGRRIFVGGLVGYNQGNISNSYSIASVSGDENVGGLTSRGGTITNSYATGNVSGIDQIGGLMGSPLSREVIITNSYWDIGSSGQNVSANEDPDNNYTGVENVSSIINNGGTYQASLKIGGGNNPTYEVADVFVGWSFGNDEDNPWVYLGDGQWPILYWQEEAQP